MRLRWIVLLLPAMTLAWPAAGADANDRTLAGGKLGFDLRYRHENVEQDGKPLAADANTLRMRINWASGEIGGFSGFLELDHNEALGGQDYDDTRNGRTEHPVIADPEGTDLNQAWVQHEVAGKTLVRLGRQRINLDNQRFVGSSDWRQNEQTFDALRIETKVIRGVIAGYSFVDQVNRVNGPDSGTPPATLEGASHLLNLKLTSLPAGELVAYGYFLDFDDAPQLSSQTLGARYELKHEVAKGWNLKGALELARQEDAGGNPARIDANYALMDLHLLTASLDLFVGREMLSGERGDFTSTENPAFQTPLATLHKWQGWADKFLTTPPAGIEDIYLGLGVKLAGWNALAVWHDFSAEATDQRYGDELNVFVARKFAKRYEVLVKYADYDADEGFTDTRKFWVQLSASF